MALGRLGDSLIHQEVGDAVTNRIYPATLGALEALPVVLENERFFAHRADQDVEQILGNHGGDFNPFVRGGKLEGEKLSAVSRLSGVSFQPSQS